MKNKIIYFSIIFILSILVVIYCFYSYRIGMKIKIDAAPSDEQRELMDESGVNNVFSFTVGLVINYFIF